MTCIGQVENDKKCLSWLNYYWPNVKKVEDIHNVKRSDFEAARVICGGFPCQPHSNAGKKLRSKDDRFLWPEMLRVLDEFKTECEFFIAENVSAIDDKHEMVLDRTIFDLENIGYEVGPPLEIPACAVNAPHERKRTIIVAHSEAAERWWMQQDIERRRSAETGRSDQGIMGNSCSQGLQGQEQCETSIEKENINTYWSNSTTIQCGDGKIRRIPSPESGIYPVAYGVPGRVAKLRGYGNAIVPQIAEIIGKSIISA
jgi:DNA (cytosine-5)-methyltransferase 1